MNSAPRGLRSRVILALHEAFCRANSAVDVDCAGYVESARDNLVPSVRMEDFEADVGSGAGAELKKKFRAVHSSTALAVNVFGPFRRRIADLVLPGFGPFNNLEFERRCCTGLRGTPPHLDVLLRGSRDVVGIESKLTEPLSKHRASFKPAYRENIRDERRDSAWFAEMLRLEQEPESYYWLDAAQLVKHAFGLARTCPCAPVTLFYIYWDELESDLCRYRRRSSGGIFAGSPDPLHRTRRPRGPRRCRPRPRYSPGRGWASVRVRLHRSRIPVRTLQRRFDTFSQEPCERLHPCPARRSPAPEKRDRHPDHRHGLRSTDSRRMRAAHS